MSESTKKQENDQGKNISRRKFIELIFGTGGALAGAAVANRLFGDENNQNHTLAVAEFWQSRQLPDIKNSFIPTNPEAPLSKETTNTIFDKLGLAEKYPKTINKDAFHLILQKPSRIAALYLQEADGVTQEEFNRHCVHFFEQMYGFSNEMGVDFIATLLMFQVSGDANSSVKAQQKDVLDEMARTGLGVGDILAGPLAASGLITVLRGLNIGAYYAMARLEGPVTLGIHDIETIMTARSLIDLEQTLPEPWPNIARKLKAAAPEFFEKYRDYVETYNKFEKESQKVTETIANSHEILEYLQKYLDPEKIKEILTVGENIDSYQLSRTTVFWSTISELDQLYRASGFVSPRKNLEAEALRQTITYYMDSKNPLVFFLDQIGNPRTRKRLEKDAEAGSLAAQKLIETVDKLEESSDSVILKDRVLAASLVNENTEQNLEFQMITGVAYARWLLKTQNELEGNKSAKLEFDNPNQLAWTAFLANLDRETGASYLLAGTRPLLRATLPFLEPAKSHLVMSSFLDKVYLKHEKQKPNKNFRRFSQRLFQLVEERLFKTLIGTPRYKVEGNKKTFEFIKAAEEFGYQKNLITLPHCSAIRAIEATAGYIAEMV